jgi:hypothetical protein
MINIKLDINYILNGECLDLARQRVYKKFQCQTKLLNNKKKNIYIFKKMIKKKLDDNYLLNGECLV